MRHQKQPTPTSCGPTCAAMLTGLPVAALLDELASVRTGARRCRRDHTTNVTELSTLLARYGLTMHRRLPGWPAPYDLALLRVQSLRRHGHWHFAVVFDGEVYDPALNATMDKADYRASLGPLSASISHYLVTEG